MPEPTAPETTAPKPTVSEPTTPEPENITRENPDDAAFDAGDLGGENDEALNDMQAEEMRSMELLRRMTQNMQELMRQQSMALVNAEEGQDTVYVGIPYGKTLESADRGKTPEYPYSEMLDAMQAVKSGGTICVVDKIDVASIPEQQGGKAVTIKGWSGTIEASASKDGKAHVLTNPIITMFGDWMLKGDTTICDITLKQGIAGTKTIYPEGYKLQIGMPEEENGETKTFIKNINGEEGDWLTIYTDPYVSKDNIYAANDSITKVDIAIYGSHKNVRFGGVSTSRWAEDKKNTVLLPNLETIKIHVAGSNTDKNTIYSGSWYVSPLPAFGDKLTDVQVTLKNIDFGGYHPHLNRGWADERPLSNATFTYNFDNVNTYGIDASNKNGN